MEEVTDYFIKVEEAMQDTQTRKEISRYQGYHYAICNWIFVEGGQNELTVVCRVFSREFLENISDFCQ